MVVYESMKRYRLVVFDLDGVIVDSEPIHETVRTAQLLAISKGRCGALDQDPTGSSTEAYYTAFIRAHQGTISGAEAARRHYAGVLQEIIEQQPEPIAGVRESIAALKAAGIALAVASSSPKTYVEGILNHFEMRDAFIAIACGDEVERLKPAPEVYRLALSRAGFRPGETLAVEDSRSGLAAATAAGIDCVGYAAPAVHAQNLEGAVKKIASMRELSGFLLS